MKNHASLSSASKAPPSPLRRPRSRIPLGLAAGAAALISCNTPSAYAETWVLTTGGSWAAAANWDPASVPNAVGAVAQFSAINAANRAITNDSGAAGFTVGSISFDLTDTGTFTNSLTTGTAGSRLILDNGGAGVTISTTGNGTGNNAISVPLVLSDVVAAQVDQTTSSSAAGSLNLTATITGTGSIIKQGDGAMTLGTGAKTYTGATVLNGGRTRISNLGQPTTTSSFTINAGAQLTLIANTGNFTFGSGPLILNGSGATSGPYAVFPGAIRNDTGYVAIINNAVILESPTLLHVEGAATGSLTFPNTVSGPGSLTLTAPNSSSNQGRLVLTGLNSYEGGTFVNGGTLVVNSDAALGLATGAIEINSGFSNATLQAADNLSTTARTLTLGIGGGTIDTNGNEITFGVGSTVTGTTLRKIGAGKLTIAGAQTYDTLTTTDGRTDLASALGTGTSTINANAETNISVSQTLDALNIGGSAVVALDAVAGFGDLAGNPGPSVPEPGGAALLFGGLGLLLGRRRRESGPLAK